MPLQQLRRQLPSASLFRLLDTVPRVKIIQRRSRIMEHIGGSTKAQHLCVLVHGLWGNPNHMNNIAKSLRATHPPEELYLLLAKRNSGSFTYDGIERGGERVCHEIEEEMKMIEEKGGKITKLSIIGYSLGGLVSRYAVGLLEAKGILDRVECMNFTTFATPHLGVRSPLKGWHNHVWNVLGARTLSMSGRQLFIIDQFRDTGRPLLAVLADPKSIFMSGMRKFKRHTLYCNIVNDRSAVYYTTGIQKTDPYRDLDSLKVNWVEGYDNVILDPANPYKAHTKVPDPTSFSSLTVAGLRWLKRIPFMIALGIFVPIGVIGYLLNSIVQNARSSSRIKLYEKGHEGVRIEQYRVPVLLKEMREEVEQVFETINSSQEQEYLRPEDESDAEHLEIAQRSRMKRERRMSVASEPTLALAPAQFEMIDGLDTLNWRKYPVWIQRIRHSHAAIIVRMDRDAFSEGKVVLKHYAQSEFLR